MNMKMIVDSIGNFDFNVLLAGFNDSSHVLTQVELISLIVLGVLGIGICLTGWKFVRVWAVIFGFVSGTVGGAAAAYFAGLAVDYIWIPGLVVGVILTALSIWKKKVGGFWLCWLMTALVGVHLLKPDSVILWGVCIGVGLLVAVVFIWFSSIVTIFVTSIFGGMVTGSCIYYLIPVNMRWIHIVLCIVAAVLGVWIQMLMESGKQKKSNLKTAEKIRENNSTENDVERARNWIDEVEEDDQMVEEDQMEKEDASEVEEEEYYFDEEEPSQDGVPSKKERKGVILSLGATFIALLLLVYCIIKGLPFSGLLLDLSQNKYVDMLFGEGSYFYQGSVTIFSFLLIFSSLIYGIRVGTIDDNRDLVDGMSYYLKDVASLLVLIFFAAQFCLIFKETNIGLFIVASLSELINKFQFTGLLLVVVTFLVVAISTFFVPMASTKWAMMSPVIVPMFMQSSMTPEFAEAVFRAADSSVKGLTPIFSYFVILIGFLHIYNKRKNDVITISDAMSLMVPYAIAFTILWLIIILAFYIIGIPIGIGTGVML